MATSFGDRPSIGLVDQDVLSARLLSRLLAAAGAHTVFHYPDAATAISNIGQRLPPDVMVVNVASLGAADLADMALLGTVLRRPLLVALAPSLGRAARDRLLAAGAAAVFERATDIDRLGREIAAIIAFWRRDCDVTGMALGA